MTEAVNDAIDEYLAVGGETSFTYTFQVNTVISPALHPIAVETRLAGVLTTLVEGVDFTVTGAGNPLGGTVVLDTGVFPAGAIAGVTWTLRRDNPVERVTDFQTAGDFFALEVNDQLDYITQILQEQDRDVDSNFANSIRLATSSLFTLGTMLDPIAGTFLRATAGGDFDWASLIPTGTATSVDETDTNATKDKLVSNLLAKDWEDWKDLMTTKGDLVSYSTTRARVGIGTEGQRLNPNTSPAIGLEWSNQMPTLAKAAIYTVVVADQGKVIPLSGASFTVNLPDAASAGDGFTIGFKHIGTSGSQQYTLDGDTTETIDGSLTKVLSVNNEVVWLVCDGSNWLVTYETYSAGSTIQTVNIQDGEVATGTALIPDDDTIPQNTEGTEFMTLAITPTKSTNKLKIDVVFNGTEAANLNDHLIIALFQDTTADAIAVGGGSMSGTVSIPASISFTHFMIAGTVSETTFKIRAGLEAVNTMVFNGGDGTGRKFGGVIASSITIKEIKV